jgi:thiamine biosynthesis lipoprotein
MNIILVSDIAVATSGDYRNGYIGRDGQWYSHTIDPRTGYPVRHQHVAVTVVADNATYADALSTALLALEPTAALALAEENALAVLLIVREEEDYKMLTSTAFQRLTAKPLN